MGPAQREPGWKFYAALWLVMLVVHQDFWFSDATTLILGVLPIGLGYQVGYSLLAAAVMALLVRVAWPRGLERLEQGEGPRR
jgi:hypothetical protein